MSNPQSQPQAERRALPPAAVDRLFARLLAIYGVQKVAAAWGEVDIAERNATWAAALGRFGLDVIADALAELAEGGGSWPPTLPEFCDRCERHDQRPGRRLSLPVPRRTADDLARGREQMDRLKAMLSGALKRPRPGAQPSRVPGADDEPPPAPAACRCWVGMQRSATLCESCAAFRRHRALMDRLRDGTADAVAEQLRDAA